MKWYYVNLNNNVIDSMKNALTLTIVLILFVSCNLVQDTQEPTIVEKQPTATNQAKEDSLTTEQIEKIKAFHSILKEVCESSLEEMIYDFKKDPNADVEIAIWTRIANAYKKCIKTWNYIPTLEMKKEMFQLMLNRSMTTDEEAMKSVKPTLLSEKEVQVVLNFYNAEPDPFDEQGK